MSEITSIAPMFSSPVTTARSQRQIVSLRPNGDGKRKVIRIMRPTLRQVQVQLKKNRRAIAAAKPGSPWEIQLKQQNTKIVNYLNSLHGKAA